MHRNAVLKAILNVSYNAILVLLGGPETLVFVIKVELQLHLSASPPTALAERSGENPLIQCKVAFRTFECFHGRAPLNFDLADEFLIPRGSTSSSFSVIIITDRPSYTIVDYRAFPVAVARVWNELPRHVTSACHVSPI